MASAVVNRVPYDWASIEIDCDDLILQGARSISYEHGMEVEKNFGASREALNRTEGVYSAEDGELTLLESDYRLLIQKFGPGYMRKVFQISVSYSHANEPTITDELIDCRIIGDAHDKQQGPDGLEVSLTISIMKIKASGIDPVNAA
jgi:hypothetical protein